MLVDSYGRTITGLRVSLTDRCNLSCFYCHREWNTGSGEIAPENLIELARASRTLGIRNIRLTGGEPMLNTHLLEIVRMSSGMFDEVSMTTNGTMLRGAAEELKASGLKRVNVSLPTLSPKEYASITGKDLWREAVEGISTAKDVGLEPVKINMVILKGINDGEVKDMVKYAIDSSLGLQLLELQPNPDNRAVFTNYYCELDEIERWLASVSHEVKHIGGRKIFTIVRDGTRGTVTTVRPHMNPDFCRSCSRLRLTCDLKLKPCLLRDNNVLDLAPAIGSAEQLERLLLKATSDREPYWK